MLNQQAWDEWIEYRKQAKFRKYMPVTVKRMQTKLMKYSLEDQQRIIDYSMDNQYQGLFPERMDKKPAIVSGLGGVF